MKIVHTDNAEEFLGMRNDSNAQGIELTTTSAYPSQIDGMAERMNRTLMNKARALIREAQLPQNWLAEALLHAAVLHNWIMF